MNDNLQLFNSDESHVPDEEVQLFHNAEYGNLRVVEIGGEPWFIAADVCQALDLFQVTNALRRLDEDERTLISNKGRDVNAINEAGLYSLVLSSKKPEAKAFKRWVTHEVLPSIRKHGGYLTPDKVEQVLTDPQTIITIAENWKVDRDRANRLQVENAALAPRALLADTALSAKGAMSLTEAARYLAQIDGGMTRKRLIELLRSDGMLCKQSLAPTREAIDRGYLEQKMVRYIDSNTGEAKTGDPYAHVTNKGLRWCAVRYCKEVA